MEVIDEIFNVLMPRSCAGCGRWDLSLCEDCSGYLSAWQRVEEVPYLTMVSPPASEFLSHAFLSHASGNDVEKVLFRDRRKNQGEGNLESGNLGFGNGRRSEEGGGGVGEQEYSLIPVWALGKYENELRKVIITWKNRIDLPLSRAISEGVSKAARELPIRGTEEINVIPAPSEWRRKHEGLFVTSWLAQAVAKGLREVGVNAYYADILKRKSARAVSLKERRSKTQNVRVKRGYHRDFSAQLGRNQGARDEADRPVRSGVFSGIWVSAVASFGRSLVPVRHRRRCLIVDDVLTTGATLAGCVYALEKAGYEAIGAVVLAAAPNPRSRT